MPLLLAVVLALAGKIRQKSLIPQGDSPIDTQPFL